MLGVSGPARKKIGMGCREESKEAKRKVVR